METLNSYGHMSQKNKHSSDLVKIDRLYKKKKIRKIFEGQNHKKYLTF